MPTWQEIAITVAILVPLLVKFEWDLVPEEIIEAAVPSKTSTMQIPILHDGPALPTPSVEPPFPSEVYGSCFQEPGLGLDRMLLLLAEITGNLNSFFWAVIPWLLLALVCGMLFCSLFFAKKMAQKLQEAQLKGEKYEQVELENARLHDSLHSLQRAYLSDLAQKDADYAALHSELTQLYLSLRQTYVSDVAHVEEVSKDLSEDVSRMQTLFLMALSRLHQFLPATCELLLQSLGVGVGTLSRTPLDSSNEEVANQARLVLACVLEDLGRLRGPAERRSGASGSQGSTSLVLFEADPRRDLEVSTMDSEVAQAVLFPEAEPAVVLPTTVPVLGGWKRTRRAGRRFRKAKERRREAAAAAAAAEEGEGGEGEGEGEGEEE